MKILEILSLRLKRPTSPPGIAPRRASWFQEAEVASPMSRHPRFKRRRNLWLPTWPEVWCKVVAEDGTFGLGQTAHGRAVAAVIDEHLAPLLVGEDCTDGERLAGMMVNLTLPYGATGLASYAVSAVDLALWDLRGKLHGKPVFELLDGPKKKRIFCYATGNDIDWYQELGFRAFKLACPYGPADGDEGMRRNVEFVAGARERIGNDCELMLDCWMAFDVEYTLRLAEALRPFRLKWMEECLIPDDFDAHLELRRRLRGQTLATGEHWYTRVPFEWALRHDAVDILQPDIQWCGGLTTCRAIAASATAAHKEVLLHAGGNTVFGQHFSLATSCVPWCEYFVGSPPGVPLVGLPGVALPKDGWLVPNDAPGFGLQIPDGWLVPFA